MRKLVWVVALLLVGIFVGDCQAVSPDMAWRYMQRKALRKQPTPEELKAEEERLRIREAEALVPEKLSFKSWRRTDEEKPFQARLVKIYNDQHVVLEMRDKSQIEVETKLLGKGDQRYVDKVEAALTKDKQDK